MSGLKSWCPQCASRTEHHKVLRIVEQVVVLKVKKRIFIKSTLVHQASYNTGASNRILTKQSSFRILIRPDPQLNFSNTDPRVKKALDPGSGFATTT